MKLTSKREWEFIIRKLVVFYYENYIWFLQVNGYHEDVVHKEPIYATIPADVGSKPRPEPNYISGPPPEGPPPAPPQDDIVELRRKIEKGQAKLPPAPPTTTTDLNSTSAEMDQANKHRQRTRPNTTNLNAAR